MRLVIKELFLGREVVTWQPTLQNRIPSMNSKFLLLLASALLAVPLSAYAQKKPAKAADPAPVQEEPVGLTADILFQYLSGEIAAQRGQTGLAADAFLDLAKRTGDPRLAQRATEAALYGRDQQLATKAAGFWLELEPDSLSARQTLVALYLTGGKIEDSVPHIKQLLAKQGISASRTFMQLFGLTARYPNKEALLKVVRELAADYQDIAEARYATAQAARSADQQALAVSEARAALDLRPDWEQAAMLYGELLSQSAPQEATKFYRQFLAKNVDSRNVRLNLARHLATQQDLSGARKEFEALLGAAPDNAEAAFAVGLLSLEMKDYTVAESSLKKALALEYRDPDAVNLYLGQMYEEQKRYKDAIATYQQVGEGEQYVASRIRVAGTLAKQGDLPAARDFLHNVAVKDDSQHIQLILADAQLLRDAKQHPQAYDLLTEALAKEPDSPELLYDHAMAAEKLAKLSVLETDLRRLIKLKPDAAHAYNALGYTLADRTDRLSEARDLIETARKLAPQDPFILDSLGWVNYRLGNLDQGLSLLKEALASRPDPEIAAHLAEVLWAKGQRKEAKSVWTDALRKNPDNEALLAVVKKLENE
jgi:tetratricopeptide (TPR) repeat protein